MPLYEDGDTEESMRRKAEESIRGDIRQGVSLGSLVAILYLDSTTHL